MTRWLWLGLALVACAQVASAGGPPGRRDGDRGGPPDRGRLEMFRPDAFGQRGRSNAFDAARRYFDLTPEQQAALAKLDEQRDAEEREARAELTKRLDKKFAALIVEVFPADQKAKYEGVLAALAARDEAIEAAQKEFRAVLDKVRTATPAQRRGFFFSRDGLPNTKADIIRQYINLTEQQHGAVDGLQRDAWTALRDKMRDIPRPQDWRDADARQKYADAMRKAREAVDTQTAQAMALLLDPEQKKAYDAAAAAMDLCNKKIAEADDACEKKLTELVGAEKAKAMRAGGFGQGGWLMGPPPGGPQGPPPDGGAPKGDAPKATAF